MAKFIKKRKSLKDFAKEINKYNLLPLPKEKYFSKRFLKDFAVQEKEMKRKFLNEYKQAIVRENIKKTQP